MVEVSTRHPDYSAARANDWQLLRDVAAGESIVKSRGRRYLPMPSGFMAQEDGGSAAYAAYLNRAGMPDLLGPSVSAMIGIAHGAEVQIEMPDALRYLWEDTDGQQMPLEVFHRQITRELLLVGRYGVLADAPEGGGEPYLAGYTGESIINWDTDFYVLDESGMERDGFDWKPVERYRVLYLDGGRYTQDLYEGGIGRVMAAQPVSMGGVPLNFIPFTVASAVDLKPAIRTPPLMGVANAAKAAYQLDADQRHQLFMSGQETLFIKNGPAPDFVGAGAIHVIVNEAADADMRYVSPSCSGIDAHSDRIKRAREDAVTAGARLMSEDTRFQESGEARGLRFASETASLLSIFHASCALLERGIRDVAALKGLPTDDIIVKAPKSLAIKGANPDQVRALLDLWLQGAISYETLYENLQNAGIASPERDAETEAELADGEDDNLYPPPGFADPPGIPV